MDDVDQLMWSDQLNPTCASTNVPMNPCIFSEASSVQTFSFSNESWCRWMKTHGRAEPVNYDVKRRSGVLQTNVASTNLSWERAYSNKSLQNHSDMSAPDL